MESNHWHLLLNHIPILGTFFGLAIFLVGLIRKNSTLLKAGLITFVVVALTTFPAYFTGEDAEHVIEEMAGTSHHMIHEHEEIAETALFLMIALALSSLVLLVVMWRSRTTKTGIMKGTVLILALITFGFMVVVGYTGGKVRRPELHGQSTENHRSINEGGDENVDESETQKND